MRAEAPRYAKLIPELPRLVHDYLAQRPHDLGPQLQRLIEEQRTTNRLLQRVWWVIVGFIAGLLAVQVLVRVPY